MPSGWDARGRSAGKEREMTSETDAVGVGRCMGRREIEVTPDLVRHYCDGVAEDPAWYERGSPFGRAVAPALLFHSEVYRYKDWYLPNVYGNLHAKQEWDLFQPTMVGERVTTLSTIVDRYVKRDRELVVNEVTCFGEDGRMLNRGRTYQSFLVGDGGERIVVDKKREKRGDRRFDVGGGDVLEELPHLAKTVTLEMCDTFSGPERNYHNDIEKARQLGFPEIVVQGMMSLCFLSEMMTKRYGEGWYRGGRMNVNLVNVLWLGEQVNCRGVVREIGRVGAQQRAEAQVWCEKSDGTVTVVGTASALVE
jgi:acyl dehydratase